MRRLRFTDATDNDVEALTLLHAQVASSLTARYGEGHWSRPGVIRRIDALPGRARVRIGRDREQLVTVLRLQTKKPWAIDTAYFTPVGCPLYLTGMAVAVSEQGQGWGRAALEDARSIARAWPADAIRLDAYDAAAGAGDFYAKCGYADRGHVLYKGNLLIYFELLLT